MESKPKILIVDDENELCETIALTFDLRGFQTFTANSGKAALEILKNNPMDILLSDVRMPEGTGPDLIRWIGENGIKVPVIALMSGYTDTPKEEFASLNVNLFFDKPFPINTVIQAIREKLEAAKK